MIQKYNYPMIDKTRSFSGQSKIDEAKRRRHETDKIMSRLWVLSPILGGVILYVTLFSAIFLAFQDDVIGKTIAVILIIIALVSYVFLIAYPWYLMIKRRTKHFKKDHLLMEGVIEYLAKKQSQSKTDLNQELATLRSIYSEARTMEDEKSPLLYTVLAIAVPWVGILYVLYFLMKDVYSHHQRVMVFMENTMIAYNKLGKQIVIPSWKTLEERNFAIYFLISCFCTPFMYYWMYSIIKDYNEHFKNQWRFEDQIASGPQTIYGARRYGTPAKKRGFNYHEKTDRPRHGEVSSINQRKMMCPVCRGQLRYITQYDKWYCDKCKKYQPISEDQNAKSHGELSKNICSNCNGKMKYITQYERWYCDECKEYK